MMNPENIDANNIIKVLESKEKPFSVKEIINESIAGKEAKGQSTKKEIEQLILDSGLAFPAEDGTYIPRKTYFQKARFLMKPQPWEFSEGIFVPGHRFLPFLYQKTMPWEVQLYTDTENRIPTITRQFAVEDLFIFYNLYGPNNLPMFLITENPDNLNSIDHRNLNRSSVDIKVFDFSQWFARTGFQENDAVECTVEDWISGTYSIRRVSEKELKEREILYWKKNLESGFQRVFDEFSLPVKPDEQIAHAFFYAGETILDNPPVHLGGFLSLSDKVDFLRYGNQVFLWHQDTSPEDLPLPKLNHLPEPGTTANLDDILIDIGMSMNSSDIESYMKDALFNEETSLNSIIERIFPSYGVVFYSQKQKQKFYKFLKGKWKKVKQEYNRFTDTLRGPIRARTLALYKSQIEWLHSLDDREIKPEDLPKQEFLELSEISGYISGLLAELNDEQSISDQMEETFNATLDDLERVLEQKMDFIEEEIADIPNPDEFTVHKGNKNNKSASIDEEDPPIYTFSISLFGEKRNVWRRIRIPGRLTLNALAEIILQAAEWSGEKPYAFIVNGIYYVPEEMYFNKKNSIPKSHRTFSFNGPTLYYIVSSEAQDFYFKYGNDNPWNIHIKIEQKNNAADFNQEASHIPLCMQGDRAFPQENSTQENLSSDTCDLSSLNEYFIQHFGNKLSF